MVCQVHEKNSTIIKEFGHRVASWLSPWLLCPACSGLVVVPSLFFKNERRLDVVTKVTPLRKVENVHRNTMTPLNEEGQECPTLRKKRIEVMLSVKP